MNTAPAEYFPDLAPERVQFALRQRKDSVLTISGQIDEKFPDLGFGERAIVDRPAMEPIEHSRGSEQLQDHANALIQPPLIHPAPARNVVPGGCTPMHIVCRSLTGQQPGPATAGLGSFRERWDSRSVHDG